jgi:hypothetical protein
MLRAFNAAKDKCKSKRSRDDYVERNEYKWLLQYLKQYYEYWVAFDQIDLDSDRRITKKEFEFALPILSKWGIKTSNPDSLWRQADANGGGVLLFDEFCDWAIKQNFKITPEDPTGGMGAYSPPRSVNVRDSPHLYGVGSQVGPSEYTRGHGSAAPLNRGYLHESPSQASMQMSEA